MIIALVMLLGVNAADVPFVNDDDPVPEKNESVKAFEMFSIMMVEEGEELSPTSVERNLICKEGTIQPLWQPPASDEKTDDLESRYYQGPYSDRISFDFFFGAVPNYAIVKPISTSSANDVATPKVVDFQIDEEIHSGSFAIVYDCQPLAKGASFQNTTIVVDFPVVSDMSVRFAFKKTCGGGEHKYLEFGHYEDSDNEGSEVSRVTFPKTGTPTLKVGPHVASTKVYLLLHAPAESQEFFHVIAKSGSPALGVSVQGPVFGGVLRKRRPTLLYVSYDCQEKGKHEVSLQIPIRPFDDLTAKWVKDCGGGIAEGLSVGTDTVSPDDVVKRGVTNEKWLLALQATSTRIAETAPVVNSSERFKDFWVNNDGIALHVAQEIITVEKPDVLMVYGTRNTVRMSGLHQSEAGELLAPGGKMHLRLRLICKKKGRSLVLVTFAIKSFHKIEFGFVKECRAPRLYRHSGFLRTASSVMLAVSLFIVTAVAACWRLLLNERRGVRKVPTPTLRTTFGSKVRGPSELVTAIGSLTELKGRRDGKKDDKV